MKIALIPLQGIVGDFAGNLAAHLKEIKIAKEHGAELVVFPELSLIGYPCQDLLLRPGFLAKAEAQLAELRKEVEKFSDLAVIVGTIQKTPEAKNRPLVNAAIFLHGKKQEVRLKSLIPFYDVFAENRFFESALVFDAAYRKPIEYKGKKIGLLICEDSWHDMQLHGRAIYPDIESPSKYLHKNGAEILINISASPYDLSKKNRRRSMIAKTAKELSLPIFYVNQFGAHDELVFDGDAFSAENNGEVIDSNESFSGKMFLHGGPEKTKAKVQKDSELENLRHALVLGIRHYVKKNGFQKVILGLSGGIDSALVAVLAADALGPENVVGISMPSKYSSVHSLEDAEKLVTNLGIKYRSLPIKMAYSTVLMGFKEIFKDKAEDLTEENLQARLRGLTVMAVANKFNYLALATGNKSEFAVGYSTLYGDMCGALSPIADLYKTQVYELAKFINCFSELIPENTLKKAPSAELRPNQTDQDSLPPYELLDAILHGLIEEELEPEAAFAKLKNNHKGLSLGLVEEIATKLQRAEYKRRQAAPGIRVSVKAFGIGRKYPLTARF